MSAIEPLTAVRLPPALAWRPITEADLPRWHALVRDLEDADDLAERNDLQDLREELLEGSWKDPAADSLLGVDADGVPRAFGHVSCPPGDVRTVRAFCWGGVHPRWRRQGIGSAVLAWQEATARRKIAAARRDVPGRMLLHAEERLVDRRALAEGAGFRAVRWYLDMSRELDDALPVPEADPPQGLRLVGYRPELREPVRLAHNEAFAEHWGSEPRSEEDWRLRSVGARTFRPDWSFVVLDGEQVAGYTLASAYPQDWPAQGYTCGWTDLLGVRAPWRGRGLARVLLAASMRAMRVAGMQRADIGVDSENASGALQIYQRLGYVAGRRSVAYAKDV